MRFPTQCLRLLCSPDILPPRARDGSLHPIELLPPLLGPVYTHKSSVHCEADTCFPETSRHRVDCAACRGILTPMRATMPRPDATRDPTAVSHRRRVRNTWTANSGCCAYTQDCLHTPTARKSRGSYQFSHCLPEGLLNGTLPSRRAGMKPATPPKVRPVFPTPSCCAM